MWRWCYVANMARARLRGVCIAVACAAAFAGCNYVFDIHDVEPLTTAATGSGGAGTGGTGGAGGSCTPACTPKPASEIAGKRLLAILPNMQSVPLLFDVDLGVEGNQLTILSLRPRDGTDHDTPVGQDLGSHVGTIQCGAMSLEIDDNFQGKIPAEALPPGKGYDKFTPPICWHVELEGSACLGDPLCGTVMIDYVTSCPGPKSMPVGATFAIQDAVAAPTEVFVDCSKTPAVLQ